MRAVYDFLADAIGADHGRLTGKKVVQAA